MLTLGVIVVHFGQPELTLRCLSHLRLQEGVRLKVIVVDNSPQGDAPLVKDSGFNPFILRCSNKGFAHANNQGLQELRGFCKKENSLDGVLLLNNDAFAMEDALHKLGIAMTRNQRPGWAVMVGGCLLNEDGSLQTRGGCWIPSHGRGMVLLDEPHPTHGILYPSGAAVLLNLVALDRLDWQLDEGYFLYFEEADTVERLRKLGPLQVFLDQNARFVHLQGATAGSGKRHHDRSIRSECHFHRSKRRFYNLHYPAFLPKMHLLHALVVFKRLIRGEFGRAQAVIRGFWG
ncbi:MAG: glycosyltransferase family 2 protein [Cytophagia bacterium]|nr:glycosyltransferase family 2 protein [Cytophagia bacterium]